MHEMSYMLGEVVGGSDKFASGGKRFGERGKTDGRVDAVDINVIVGLKEGLHSWQAGFARVTALLFLLEGVAFFTDGGVKLIGDYGMAPSILHHP